MNRNIKLVILENLQVNDAEASREICKSAKESTCSFVLAYDHGRHHDNIYIYMRWRGTGWLFLNINFPSTHVSATHARPNIHCVDYDFLLSPNLDEAEAVVRRLAYIPTCGPDILQEGWGKWIKLRYRICTNLACRPSTTVIDYGYAVVSYE